LFSPSSVLIYIDILEYPCPSQPHNYQTRTRRYDRSVENGAERPLKRARLIEKNLKAFENIGGRQRKTVGKFTEQSSSTTTTTDKDFGIKLQQNKVFYTSLDAQAPDDIAKPENCLIDHEGQSHPIYWITKNTLHLLRIMRMSLL
jgi:hypothetical protein